MANERKSGDKALRGKAGDEKKVQLNEVPRFEP
jgi:hypothetical protein